MNQTKHSRAASGFERNPRPGTVFGEIIKIEAEQYDSTLAHRCVPLAISRMTLFDNGSHDGAEVTNY